MQSILVRDITVYIEVDARTALCGSVTSLIWNTWSHLHLGPAGVSLGGLQSQDATVQCMHFFEILKRSKSKGGNSGKHLAVSI